jgi:hypothetical protein
VDLIHELAYPLPVTVIATMLGVPVEECDRFKGWADAITVLVNPIMTVTPDQINRAAEAYQELLAYLRQIVARLRLTPDTSLLAAMAAAGLSRQRQPPGAEVAERRILRLCKRFSPGNSHTGPTRKRRRQARAISSLARRVGWLNSGQPGNSPDIPSPTCYNMGRGRLARRRAGSSW